MAAHEFINPNQHLYHGTSLERAKEIMRSGGVDPSGNEVPAGASGIYTTSTIEEAKKWGSHVVVLQPTQRLKIHKDINDYPHLHNMRIQNQFATEWKENEYDPEEWEDYFGGRGFPLTEESARNAQDVSLHLKHKGYHGHRDSLTTDNEIVVYNPDHLKTIAIRGRGYRRG